MGNRKRALFFRWLVIVFVAGVIAITIDIFSRTSPPGKKKFGVEALEKGREEVKKKLPYKRKIERKLGKDTADSV